MSDKYERLLDHLVQSDGWVTASELADQLGVTTRSVRRRRTPLSYRAPGPKTVTSTRRATACTTWFAG